MFRQALFMPGLFHQESARPLGKGYSEIMQMVLSYASAEKQAGNPTLSHSLERIRLMPEVKKHLTGLREEPLCLIQGYSTPGNAEALRQFINDHIGSFPSIETVDLYDLPHLYDVLDIKLPPMRYHIADAAHLDELYKNGAVDLVVQDFLLNCIPASRHEQLLKEVSRILKPDGLGIISFTSNEALEISAALSTTQLLAGHKLTWDAQAYDLAELAKVNQCETSLDYLMGKLIYHQPTSEFIYIAQAGGRFEFFRTKEDMLSLFEKCGLHLRAIDMSQGSDDHGLSCVRYRCILGKSSAA